MGGVRLRLGRGDGGASSTNGARRQPLASLHTVILGLDPRIELSATRRHMNERRPFIATYILASRPLGVLYVGMTSNLYERTRQHREDRIEGFAQRYGCKTLVWYERHGFVTEAIKREKALKRWNRTWKLELVEQTNPQWQDLYPSLCGLAPDPRVKPEDDGEGEGSVRALLRRLDDV
ncbi:GIY-YIG nuclease family protein [Brevundimonas diminuta]